jgi:osmoprotectant transport system permease protein
MIEHFFLTAISVVIITIAGLLIGIYITRNKKSAQVVMSLVNFIYTIPSIALFGFLVSITGIGNKSAIIALVIYGLLPVIKNTYVGIQEVEPMVVESAVAMGSSDFELLINVQLPIAMPVILAGIRIMVVMTIALGGIASFIGAGGLGVAIWRGITTNYAELTFAGSILVAVMAIGADILLSSIEKALRNRIYGSI